MMPSIGDQVPVGLGDGVELGLFNGFVQAGVQGVQDVQYGDKRKGGGGRLDSNAPGKPGCDDAHDLGRRVSSGHGKMRVINMESVWVWWKGDIEANTLWVGKEVMERGRGKS